MIVPETPAKRRAYIKFELGMRGLTIGKLADQLGVTSQAISNAFNSPSFRIEQGIAEAIGKPVQVIFADRYDDNGNRLYNVRDPNRSIYQKRRNDQTSERR